MMAVSIGATGQFDAGVPQALFQTGAPTTYPFLRVYAVTKDGKRFLVNARPAAATPLTVVVNWLAANQK